MRKTLVAILVSLSVLTAPVVAQEVTEPAPVVTETPAPPVSEPPAAPDPFNFVDTIIGAIIGGLIGVSGVLAAIGRIKNDKATLDAIEWAGKNIPVEGLLEIINAIGKNMRDAGEVIDKVTDGQPNDIVPPSKLAA